MGRAGPAQKKTCSSEQSAEVLTKACVTRRILHIQLLETARGGGGYEVSSNRLRWVTLLITLMNDFCVTHGLGPS